MRTPLFRGGTLALGAAIALVPFAVAGGHTVLVLGGYVARWSHAETLLVLLGLGAWGASALARREPAPDGRGAARRWAVGLGVTGLALVAVAGWGLVALLDSGTSYHLLDPASAQGCRVVVAEHSVLMMGSGTVYALEPGQTVASPVDSFTADDGYTPISHGTYTFGWDGETAELHVWGETHRPVAYDAWVSCADRTTRP